MFDSLWDRIAGGDRRASGLFDLAFALEIVPDLLVGALVTIAAAVAGFLLALLVGLVLVLMRRSGFASLQLISIGLVEGVRGTPLLVQLYFMFFVLPNFGILLPPFETGVLTLGIHYGAYMSEVYRGGLDAVARGQWEAAAALRLGRYRTYRHVILPQGITPMVPALGNLLVALFKETPLLSTIGVLEMMQTAKLIGSETFRYIEPITIVGLFYLVLTLVSASLISAIEESGRDKGRGRRVAKS